MLGKKNPADLSLTQMAAIELAQAAQRHGLTEAELYRTCQEAAMSTLRDSPNASHVISVWITPAVLKVLALRIIAAQPTVVIQPAQPTREETEDSDAMDSPYDSPTDGQWK